MRAALLSANLPLGNVSDPGEDEELLLARCRLGDGPALRELYERNVQMVIGMARQLGAPAADVDDIVQEVFVAAFRDLAKVRPGFLSGWLFRLTSYRVHDRYGHRRIRETFARLWRGTSEPDPNGPEETLLRRDAERSVERILTRMSRKKREVFALYELQGIAGEDIASLLGIPLDTVWSRLGHARSEFTRIGRSLELFEQARMAPKSASSSSSSKVRS